MAKREAERYGMAVVDKYRENAYDVMSKYNLDTRSQWQKDLDQNQADFNNYLSSGNWTTENNQKYRDQAAQAVRDLSQQQMRYGKGTNEYKQLEQYKNFYESTVPSLDRMDVFANVNGYIGNWTDKGFDSWHSEDDYNSQREYLDLKRGELQSQIDELEKQMKEKGELYSPDLDSMKQYRDLYDQLSEGLDQRHQWDKQFESADDYVAYQNSFDYGKVMQAEKSLAEKQAELEAKTARLSGLEAKFSQSDNTLLNGLAAALGGDVNQMRQSSAMVNDPEGYQEMLALQKEVALLQSDIESGQKDIDRYHEYQTFNVLQSYGKFDPSKNWEKEVDSLKEAYNKAEEGSVEQEKIGRQLTALAGSNWDGTDERGLFDEGNYLGRWYLQNIDVDADRKRYTELEDELKAMDASTTEGNALLRFLGEAATNAAQAGTSAGGGNYFNISGQNAAAAQATKTAELESDQHVHDLRSDKRRLNQNIQSAEKYQNRAGFDANYNALPDEQRTTLIEAGKAAVAKDGKSYTNGKGQSVKLQNFESVLDDETDPELRDKIYAAIGAELTGSKLGYSVSDIVDAYSERLAQYAGYKRAEELNNIKWAPARWVSQVVGEQALAGFNQFDTGVDQLFSDDAIEGNKRFYTDQATDQMIGENYGDPILNGRNFSQLLADTTQTTANMLPSIVASSAVSYVTKNPTVGAAVGAVLMGASSAGNAYQTALNEGWEKDDARIFAAITGAAEGGLQYLLGGVGKLGGISEEGLLQLAGRMNNAAIRAATKTAIHIGSETFEELIQNRIERYLRYKIAGEDSDWMSWNEEDWYTVFVTALSTGALEGPGSIATEIKNTRTGNALAGNVIPSKGFTQKQQQWNASLKMAGELIGNDTAAKTSLIAFGTNTNLVEAGGQANRIAERIASGKMAANATNLGMLYSEIISEYAEEGKPGVQAAMAGVIGGAVQYNKGLDAKTDLKAAQDTYEQTRAANKGAADVLDMNTSKLVELGASTNAAKEFAPIINKIMSGTNLTDAEINKLLSDSTAAQAARVALGQDTNIHFSLTRGNVNAAREIVRSQVQFYKDQKAALKQAKEAAVAEAQKAAVDGVVVEEAASKADPVGQQFGDPQDLVKASEIKDLQKAESDVQAAEARVNAIQNADTQALGMGSMLEYADEERAGTVDAVIETQQLHDLREQKEALDDRAAKLSGIKFPSKAQRTELANIREETAGVQRQIDAINNARAERIVARAQAAAAPAQAEPAQNSSGSAGEVTLPNGTKMARSEYVDNAVEQAKKENPNLSEEEIAKIREEANAEFDRIAEQTGGKVTEDGRRNESSASDEQRNDVGDTADGREDSQRTGETRSDVGRDATGRTELFAENSVNNAVYAGEGAVITSSEDSDALHAEYPELRGLNDSLKASGFTNIRYVTKGQILAVVNRETGETRSVPALVRGTELLLRLDFNSPNYDYVATAEHERTHLQLGFLRDHLGVEETRAFVTSTLQNLLGQQAYENAFMKYWAQYGEAYYKDGQNDTTTVGHMVNEEMFCDMVAGINEWGAGLGEFKGEIDEVLTDARFAEFTQALAEGEDPYASLIYEETEPNALPYGLQVKETFDITDPFRNDVDRTKPPESRPLPGEEAMHEEQQLMSLQSMAEALEATGYELLTNDEGYPYGLKNKKTGELVTNVTPDMMVDTPIGNLITTAVGNGFISQNAANKEYKMLADVMNLILKNNAADLTWELVGSQLFSGIKKNSDTQYNWTIDFGTICRKTQDLIDAMSATMKKVGHGLTRREIEAVYLETGKAGAATPCPVCYVFSRWMGIGGLLDQINTFQDTYFTIQTDENGNFVSFDWAEGKSEQDLASFMNDIDAKIVAWAEDKQKADFFKDEKAEKKFARDNLNFGKILSDMKASPNRRQADAIKKINDSRQAQIAIDELEKRAENATPEHAAKIRKAADSMREFVLSDDQIVALEQKLADAEKELAVFELYQWADRAVLERTPGKIDVATGERELQWRLHPDYKPVPQSILFDLNKGADFAEGFARTWAFRTGKGNAMGKAIMPYSDARIGETIQGVASGGVKLLNEEMLSKLPEDDKKAVKAAMKNADILSGKELNPFLNGKDKARDKIMTKAIEAMRRQNLIGGMRLQSTSDFRFEWGSDYLITFFELQAIGANVQLYTKVIEAVDFLASTNSDCNLSVMPLGLGYSIDPETNEAKLDFSSVTGINAEEAIKKAKQYDNVQLILVGINDTNIRLALAGTDVTFVIPFHGSGQSVDQVQTLVNLLGEDLDVQSAQDYSDVQDDHIDPRLSKEEAAKAKAMRALRMDIIQGKFWEKPSKKNKNKGQNKPLNDQQRALLAENPHLQRLYDMFYNERQAVDENGNPRFTQCMLNSDGTSMAYHCFLGKKQAEKIFPYEYWDTSLDYKDADQNGENFKSYCASLGIIPRFSGIDADGKTLDHGDFSNDPGYWKLLIDRKMYSNKYTTDENGNKVWAGYGKYRNQQKINASNIKIEDLDPQKATDRIPEKDSAGRNARTKALRPDLTEKIVENSVAAIEKMRSEGDIYDTKKISKEFRAARTQANKDAREAEQQMSLQQGEETTTYIPDGVNTETGEPVDFIKLMLDRKKLGETRKDNPGLTRKWTGLVKGKGDPTVYGRVKFGKPYQITNQSPEYESAYIKGTNYDLADGETAWYYPIEEIEDFRGMTQLPQNTPNGNYGKYTVPVKSEAASKEYANFYPAEDSKGRKVIQPKGASLTKSTAQSYNENAQQRFSQQEGENNGRENTVDSGATRRVVDKVNQLLPGNDWARSFVEAARSGNSGVDAGSAWRADEKRQQRVRDFAAFFFHKNKFAGFQIDKAVDPNKKTLLFEYGAPDFLNWFFTELAKDPEGLEISLNANLDNADKFLKGVNNAMNLNEEPEYPTGHNWTPEDEEYMEAIEKNDIAKLEKMVKQAARKAGYNREFYQHARTHFTEFSKGEFGFHLGSWTQAAEFIRTSYSWFWNPRASNPDMPHLSLHLYADVKKPYILPKIDVHGTGRMINDYSTWFTANIATQLSKDPKLAQYKSELEKIAQGEDTDEYNSRSRRRITSILEQAGYDALQYTNDAEGNKKRDSAKAYILWNPEQIKSADLITYDEKGNVIPISKRFNKKDTEFRFSMQEEETTNPFPKDTLAGDLMDLALSGDVEAMNNWLNREMDKYNQKKEQAKIIPPRVPTREFVPKPTKEEMDAIEKKRLDQIGQYGAHKPSNQRVSDDYVLPKKDELGRGRSKFVQNVASASNVLDEPARDHAKRFAFTEDTAVYAVDENDADIKAAKEKIKDKGVDYCVQNFLENAEDMTWKDYAGNTVTKVLAMGQQLLIETSTNGTYRDYLDVLSALTLLANQAGKSLQAFNMLKKSGPIGELYYVQKTVNQLNNKQYAKLIEAKKMSAITVDPDLEKAVVMAKTDKAREEAMNNLIASIAKQVPVTVMDKWNAWRHFAMLGNARTHIRNVFGNAIFMPLRFAKNLLAATNETIAVKTGLMKEEDRTKSFTISRELRDFAKKDALVMQKELQGNGKYNPAQEILDARQIFAWRGLDKASKWNGQMLEKEDWWFLAPAYQKALGMALMHSGFTVEELENSTEGQKALVRARRIAIEEAQRATYRDFSVAAAALNRLKRGGGMGGILLEGVMPFTKTPINILKRGIEYSPVGIATALFGLAKDFHNGSINASQFIDRMSAGLSGTMLAVLGMVLAKAGWLRGKKDDKEEDFDKLQGYQDYSLQIGDVSATIDWAAPGALPLFTGVAAWDMMQGEEELSPAMIWDAVLLIAEPMMSLSMLDGLNKTLSAASYAGENEKLVSIASTALTSYLGQAFPTLGGQLARSIDGTRRQTYVDKNSPIPASVQRFVQSSVQNKIPGWESQKAAYIDQWGREDTTKRKILGALENFLSPSYINLVNTTDVDEEIGKLYEATKENNILPSSPTKKIGDKQLTADEYVSYAKDVGTTKYNLLAQMFSDPRYLSLSDEDKIKAIKKIYDYANAAGKYHIEPTYDIRKNGGVWVQEAEAMPNDLLRYNRIWEAIAKAIED